MNLISSFLTRFFVFLTLFSTLAFSNAFSKPVCKEIDAAMALLKSNPDQLEKKLPQVLKKSLSSQKLKSIEIELDLDPSQKKSEFNSNIKKLSDELNLWKKNCS